MIILASSSPRRRELMHMITDDFRAVSVDADETIPEGMDAMKASEYLAEIKAKAAHEAFPDDVVIGCDTTVICDGKILGKPKDKDEARAFMQMLSGRTHSVCTGCCIISREATTMFSVCTDVTFYALSPDEIEEYISTPEPYDKAGGYGIQGRGALIVEKIDGDYYSVVGLPVACLNRALKKF